jgi:DnaJ-class molecular chaperone
MGKHSTPQECKPCEGSGQIEEWHDGKVVMVTCKLCHGTGQQP